MSMCRVFSCVVGRGCFLWPVCSLDKTVIVSLFSASFCTPRPNLPVTPGISWLPTFAFQSPLMKRTSFGGVSSKRSYRSSQSHSTSASSALLVRAKLGLTVILNGLPWKWTEIILSFLRLHPSTAFQTLLLTMMATPFFSHRFLATAAAAAASLQSCPTLCDPIDGSQPGFPSLGFSRQEHWSRLSFPSPMHESEKWKWSRSVVSNSSNPMNCSLPGSSVQGIF